VEDAPSLQLPPGGAQRGGGGYRSRSQTVAHMRTALWSTTLQHPTVWRKDARVEPRHQHFGLSRPVCPHHRNRAVSLSGACNLSPSRRHCAVRRVVLGILCVLFAVQSSFLAMNLGLIVAYVHYLLSNQRLKFDVTVEYWKDYFDVGVPSRTARAPPLRVGAVSCARCAPACGFVHTFVREVRPAFISCAPPPVHPRVAGSCRTTGSSCFPSRASAPCCRALSFSSFCQSIAA
jgi:hypothetical protein